MHNKKFFYTIIVIIILCFIGSASLIFRLQKDQVNNIIQKNAIYIDTQREQEDMYAHKRSDFELGERWDGSKFWRSIDQYGNKEGVVFGEELADYDFEHIDEFNNDAQRSVFIPNDYELIMVNSFTIDSRDLENDQAQLFISYKLEELCEGDERGPGCIEKHYYVRIIRPIQNGWELIFDYKIVDTNYAVDIKHFKSLYKVGNGYELDGLRLYGGKVLYPELGNSNLFIVFDEQKDELVDILPTDFSVDFGEVLLTQEEIINNCELNYNVNELDNQFYHGEQNYYYGVDYPNSLVWVANVRCPHETYAYQTVRQEIKTFWQIQDYTLVPYTKMHIFNDTLYRGSVQISDTPIDEIIFKDSDDKKSLIGESMSEFAYAGNIAHEYNYNDGTDIVIEYYADCWPCGWLIPRKVTLDSADKIVGVTDLDVHKGFYGAFYTVGLDNNREILYAFNNPDGNKGIELRLYNLETDTDAPYKWFYYDDEDIFKCKGTGDEGIECTVDGHDAVKEYMNSLLNK